MLDQPGFIKRLGNEVLDAIFPPPEPSPLRIIVGALTADAETRRLCAQWIERLVDRAFPPAAPPACVTVVPPSPPKPFVPLGEFTCPKCGGHTWGTLGPLMAPIWERYCTNGLETAYGPGLDPNTVKTPCDFRWMETDDAKYFTPPAQHAPAVPWVTPYDELARTIGKRIGDDETVHQAAARIIREADEYIQAQATKIDGLIRDNEFKPGNGEIGIHVTPSLYAKLPAWVAVGSPATLVLTDARWAIRVTVSESENAMAATLHQISHEEAIECLLALVVQAAGTASERR